SQGRPVTLKPLNAGTRGQAEGDVFQQAYDAGQSADEATLYVDRPLCPYCGDKGGVGSLMRATGIKKLRVVAPDGEFTIDATVRPSAPKPVHRLGGYLFE